MKGRSILIVAAVALGALLLTACGGSETTVISSNQQNGINVQGQGIAYGAPDVADIDIGVQATARDVSTARDEAARTMDAVNKAIKANGITDADIKTTQFSVDPRYSSGPPPTNTQTITGYQVTNVVTVRIRKLDTVGKIVDDATAAGGNNTVIRRMVFSILDQTKLQTEARALAVKDAKDRGDKLAQLNGVKLGKAQTISESVGGSGPIPLAAPASGGSVARADFATTIESGQLRIVVNVNINYAID